MNHDIDCALDECNPNEPPVADYDVMKPQRALPDAARKATRLKVYPRTIDKIVDKLIMLSAEPWNADDDNWGLSVIVKHIANTPRHLLFISQRTQCIELSENLLWLASALHLPRWTGNQFNCEWQEVALLITSRWNRRVNELYDALHPRAPHNNRIDFFGQEEY